MTKFRLLLLLGSALVLSACGNIPSRSTPIVLTPTPAHTLSLTLDQMKEFPGPTPVKLPVEFTEVTFQPQKIKGYNAFILDLTLSPDDKNIIGAVCYTPEHSNVDYCAIGKISVWDSSSGKLLYDGVTHHEVPVYQVAFSPNGNKLASASCPIDPLQTWLQDCSNEKIILWDTTTFTPNITLSFPGKGFLFGHISFKPDGSLIAVNGNDSSNSTNNVVIWDTKTGVLVHQIPRRDGFLTYSTFNPQGTLLAVTYKYMPNGGSEAYFFDTNSWHIVGKISSSDGSFESIAFSPDGTKAAIALNPALNDSNIVLVDTTTFQTLGIFKQPYRYASVTDLSFTQDGVYLIEVSDTGSDLMVWKSDNSVNLMSQQDGDYIVQPFHHSNKFIVGQSSDVYTIYGFP